MTTRCDKCGSIRIVEIEEDIREDICVCSVSSAMHGIELSYIPKSLDIAFSGLSGVDFKFCAECGKIQGKFPKEKLHDFKENENGEN